MTRSVGATVFCLLLAACGGSGSASPPSSVAASASPPSSVAASASGVLPLPSSGTLPLCPSPNAGATCPLSPGRYTVAIHDAYTLTIEDTGWQVEPSATPAEDEPTVILSRTDAPDQRLSIDTGHTSGIRDAAGMASLLAGTATFQMGAPSAAHVGTAAGFQVDLAPTEARQVSVSGAGTYVFNPGHRYRLMALQLPMDQESGIKVIIVDAPTATFDAFLPLANAILQSVQFLNPA